ncbi:defensin Ec-AMP-D1-like [Lolium rigidum]|uniref:defensin Ec-AMP-D1-like n=1 Tax=Lolium rigidum TaxID=89674 RepID=UPI001F5CAF2E|nr:defensin Ec-AMP-D1-like [Lolium rigidum]
MDLSMKVFVVIFLVLLTTEEGLVPTALARQCRSQSHKYKGPCVSDSNCGNVCFTEGFTGGKCDGFRHRCFCTRDC